MNNNQELYMGFVAYGNPRERWGASVLVSPVLDMQIMQISVTLS